MRFVRVIDDCMAMFGGVSWCSQWVGIWGGGRGLVGSCGCGGGISGDWCMWLGDW